MAMLGDAVIAGRSGADPAGSGPKGGAALQEAGRSRIGQVADRAKQDHRAENGALLDAALAIVAEHGVGGLTLRPLAKRLGYPVATFARQIGAKDDLLCRLITLAAHADEEMVEPWLRLVESFESLPTDALIDITEEVLRLRAGSRAARLRTHFRCELVQAAAFNPRLRPALLQWIEVDRIFWRALCDRATQIASFDMIAALEGFAIEDGAKALILDDFESYRWMRREGIRRLWRGLFDGEPTTACALFERALSVQPSPNGVPYWTARPPESERDRTFGAIIAEIILEGGTDAITHREVARRAGTPHSSLAYHYPLQDELVELGMNTIVEMIREGSAAAMDGKELPIVAGQLAYASFAISLAAAHRPSLRPIAREMRRRRGDNLLPWLLLNAADKSRIDMANVQAMSCALIGSLVLSRAALRDSAPLTRQLFAQLGDWPDLLARFPDQD